MKIVPLVLMISSQLMYSITHDTLHKIFVPTKHPFNHNLGIKIVRSKQDNAGVMICCHGYASDNRIINAVASSQVVIDHLISFNFPDHNFNPLTYDHRLAQYGTIQELLPLLYIIKQCIIDAQLSVINLYGFSAGGGAIINALAVLNQSRFDTQLESIGITHSIKKQIIDALERGIIILDCPLKSMDEIIAFRGASPALTLVAQSYARNNLRPLDSIKIVHPMKLNLILHFQHPDEILSNHDDARCIEYMRAANKGTTHVVIGNDGGHNAYHASLWNYYAHNQSKGTLCSSTN